MISKYCDRLRNLLGATKDVFCLRLCGSLKTESLKFNLDQECATLRYAILSTDLFHLVVCQSRPAVLSSHSQSPSSSLTTSSINIKRG